MNRMSVANDTKVFQHSDLSMCPCECTVRLSAKKKCNDHLDDERTDCHTENTGLYSMFELHVASSSVIYNKEVSFDRLLTPTMPYPPAGFLDT